MESAIKAPSKITFYGPATNPYVKIGDNRYEVDVAVLQGQKVVIDSTGTRPTAILYDNLGNGVNVFQYAVRDGGENGGSYAFLPFNPGLSIVNWQASFTVDLEWLERESEPVWTL